MTAPERPELTLPEAEAALLRAEYAGAKTVLEYGSGGSTLVAAEGDAAVWSVESDADWAAMMRGWFAANPAKGAAQIHHVDIGPTRDWGHPADETGFRRWPDYALSVWDRHDFAHPDVVLVDGRFRVGCFLSMLYRISRPVVLLFDDYANRPGYHRVEELVKPRDVVGRMARFDLRPTPLTPDRLRGFAKALLQPA
ncbi:hypothetical protein [Neotabrizicola sp. VNH66]|uniref:hypothetical protein n=1 Tax=Neotabrizicola sp. VNH66 TaxID=3400918 RepID=UPI003C0CF2D0